MSVAVEIATRWHVADPPPSHCSACFRSADPKVRFYTPDSAIDRGVFVDAHGAHAVLDSMDWMYVCASIDENGKVVGGCVKDLLEFAGFKPELHARQLREIRRLEVESESWRAYAKRLEATLQDRPEPAPASQARRRS